MICHQMIDMGQAYQQESGTLVIPPSDRPWQHAKYHKQNVHSVMRPPMILPSGVKKTSMYLPWRSRCKLPVRA